MRETVLVVDDEQIFREDLAQLLEEEGHRCVTAATGEAALELLEEECPSLVITDLMMPGIGGVEVVDRVATRCPDTPVLVVTAFGSMDTALEAFRKGAADYLLKPLVLEDLSRKVERALEERRLRHEVRYLRRELSDVGGGTTMIGSGQEMERVRKLIAKVAEADTTILVSGETGTGKELVARVLHEQGRGPDRPFVAVNCAALPGELFESELFGHVRGAFTGAVRDRPGFFELARGGTLFLDEIGELPLELQPKLLRAIETGEVTPVGGSRPVEVSARIVAATNRDLSVEVEEGGFREDLFYRIRILEISVPPLRERRSDIPALVEHFIHRLNPRLGRHILGVDRLALGALTSAPWPGNVRELENVVERAILLTESDVLGLEDLPAELAGSVTGEGPTEDLRAAVHRFEARHIRQVLAVTDGNREEAARRLGIDPSTLYRRLKSLDIG